MKIAIPIILFVHGLIHLMGFAKAFGLVEIEPLSGPISKSWGWVWLLAALLFLVTFVLFILKKDVWPVLAIAAVLLSQILILTVWSDAKFGTLVNLIILIAAIIGLATQNFENGYQKDVALAIEKTDFHTDTVTEKDLVLLPEPVKKYLRYVGAVGKPKVYNVKIVFEGEMRDKNKDWFAFTSEQYNFFEDPTRLFFMKAKIKGLSTYGYHCYKKNKASMSVKLLSLLPVLQVGKPELFPTETVTFFNDLCLFAPAVLIDDRISWKEIDDRSAKATFSNKGTTISAILHFNEKGQLVNFDSNDRIAVDEMKTYPFSTPVKNYLNSNGFNLPTYGEAVWHYPDGKFVYGRFELKEIEYNVSEFEKKILSFY
ncbi:hypothetical protein K8352_04520 [Flavobacteriaceae bacterium F89]|uniref:Uncharacterized protein n=1 Tax=Cerina litoralis TaxID=2874477 RepID=A0AAE3ES73_9FLAO|nr:DUF6544 family protein [Cerina litoralis]MCG2459998.1 hypothetical protein [Cerina litoralis]